MRPLSAETLNTIRTFRTSLSTLENQVASTQVTPRFPAGFFVALDNYRGVLSSLDEIIRLGTASSFDHVLALIRNIYHLDFSCNRLSNGAGYLQDQAISNLVTPLFKGFWDLTDFCRRKLSPLIGSSFERNDDIRQIQRLLQEESEIMRKREGELSVSKLFPEGVSLKSFTLLVTDLVSREHLQVVPDLYHCQFSGKHSVSNLDESQVNDITAYMSVYAADRIGLALFEATGQIHKLDWDLTVSVAAHLGTIKPQGRLLELQRQYPKALEQAFDEIQEEFIRILQNKLGQEEYHANGIALSLRLIPAGRAVLN